MVILDIIVILFMCSIALVSYKKGLTASLFKIIGFILSIIIVIVLHKPLANLLINNTKLDETIEKQVVFLMNSKLEGETTGNLQNAEEIEVEVNSTINAVPKAIGDYVQKKVEGVVEEAKDNVMNATARAISLATVDLVATLILFIGTNVIVIILKVFTSVFTSLPIIHQADQLGGLIYGVVEAFFVIYVILAIVSLIVPIVGDVGITEVINKTGFLSRLYNNNLLLKLIFRA